MGNIDFSCEPLLQAALDTFPEHVAVIDVQGTIVMVNEAWRQFSCKHSNRGEAKTGVSANYFEVCRNTTGEARSEAYATLKGLQAVADGTLPEFSLEYTCWTPTGVLWFSVAARPLGSPDVGVIVSHADISQKKKYAMMAFTDPLTGVANRRSFTNFTALTLDRAQREGQKVAFVVADLNGFKGVNDKYGHEEGDELLRAFAKRLRSAFREADFVARLGGDEFATVLSVSDEAALASTLERCLAHLDQPYTFGDLTLTIGVSLGVSLFPRHGVDRDSLMRSADRALYESKRRGGGVSFYVCP